MSETKAARQTLAQFCLGIGMDLGFGGSAITPTTITFDQSKPYTNVGNDTQILRGDCRNLFFICDNALDYMYSSHLLEDFSYDELKYILAEWRRCLKNGGLLITNCPDQQKFLAHCNKTGQPLNLAHKEQDFSLENFKNIAYKIGNWEVIFEEPNAGAYSWYLVLKKIS